MPAPRLVLTSLFTFTLLLATGSGCEGSDASEQTQGGISLKVKKKKKEKMPKEPKCSDVTAETCTIPGCNTKLCICKGGVYHCGCENGCSGSPGPTPSPQPTTQPVE